MKYDFTSIIERKGKDALAVDLIGTGEMIPAKEGFSPIPMWVADMNFATCPGIREEIVKRVSHPIFGYFLPRDEYFNAIIDWQKRQNGVEGLTKEEIGYENGVLGGVASALRALALPGDAVLLHKPAYIGFTGTLTRAGYKIVHSELKRDEEGVWRMDYQDMDRKIKENNIHVAVFCSPHNPCGRVWTKEEILEAMEVFRRNQVYVISDEIWSDIVLYGKHIPTQSVSEDAKMRTMAFYAPTKTFNLAGLIGSYHIIYDPYLRDRVCSAARRTHYNSMNVLSMYALIGAYSEEGREWLGELLQVLRQNCDYACDYITTHFQGVSLARAEGTYMLYLDCSEWLKAHGLTCGELLRRGYEVGVYWQDGRPFHMENSIRMNLALPSSRVEEAFRRLDQYVFNA
ncbi:MAG: aminotransferase class I/II-fold pyridoxal phosphate-dependent enzyme [Lachnospiraceae bacterium]|nr:aminotransferase class I/II-fold pyridoxal phosphate-dependent enzyme [Lachnospiraceae bacterium]